MIFLDALRIHHPLLRGKVLLMLIATMGTALALGLMAVRLPLLAIGAELVVLLALAILAWPDVSTLAVIFVIYSNAASIAVRFHGVPYIFGAAIPVVLIVPLASYLIFRRQKIIINPVLPLIFLFLTIQVISTLLSRDLRQASSGLIEFVVEGIMLYFLTTNVVRTPQMLRRVVWVLLLTCAFLGFLSFYQQVAHTFQNNYWGFAQMSSAAFGTGAQNIQGEVMQRRLAGPLGEENRYAQFMLMVVPLGLFRFWGERKKALRIAAGIATGFTVLGMALTFSRGAALAFFILLVIMAFMRYIRPYQLAIVVLGLILLLVAFPQYGRRVSTLQGLRGLVSEEQSVGANSPDGSLKGRLTENLVAVLVFVDYPVFGVGPRVFHNFYQDYATTVGIHVQAGTRQAHNLYLGVAAETGALGLICFLTILFVTLRDLARARKRWMRSRPDLASMATGFMLAIITYLTTGIFLHFAYIRYFWLMMALASVASYTALQIPEEPESDAQGGENVPPTARELATV